MGKSIAVTNEKGGVGKTTVSVQLAHKLSESDFKVLLVDNDSSGDATTALFGEDIPETIKKGNQPEGVSNTIKMYNTDTEPKPIQVRDNLFLLGATDALSVLKGADMEPVYEFCDSIEVLKEDFDYIIIDCPPSFGLLFTSAIMATDGIIIPVIPEDFAFNAAKKVEHRIKQMNRRMGANQKKIAGVIANKVKNNPTPKSVTHYLEELKDNFGSLLFNTQINETIKISDAISLQESITDYAKPDTKAVKQISAFTDEVIARMEKI
ncbi:ParA family protein [Spartinivicinus poritis]|uniref:ParA family protein n=1 Tax=Spartinivicinus poritis TaxID=2994640 RepID=A0ABT5UHK2_9GAMM|nr:ParA family protein [Spartinivicinus sp. A2-2]MDE1465846.1 ParA family protein [Spartinivicinus sp. A2-2]